METKTPQIEDGYTRIANEILEQLYKINLTSYQIRIILFIFRKTYGYNKKEDWISVSQIVEGTGIKQSHVSRTKKELLLKNMIYTPTGIKIAFQKNWRLWKLNIPNEVYRKNIPVQVKNIPSEDKDIPVQGNTKDNIQKTIYKRHISVYTSLQNIDLSVMEEIAVKYKVPIAFVQSKFDDMSNWLASKGKTYKNYKAALSNWVKTDALKIMDRERQHINKFKVTQL